MHFIDLPYEIKRLKSEDKQSHSISLFYFIICVYNPRICL